MSKLEMKVPSPGESISEVEIATWLVSDGDYVEKDQAIAEVDSDKATLELPAEEAGIITLKAEEGDTVEVGAVCCLIDTSAKAPAGKPKQPAPAPAPAAASPAPQSAPSAAAVAPAPAKSACGKASFAGCTQNDVGKWDFPSSSGWDGSGRSHIATRRCRGDGGRI
jgi:2-oxoglutarate dehydrogenase E2 component (dihydrolipoamide succinyltransferase)